ncbi:cytochrome b/b6/petB-like protein [Ophiocordyceps camponoti-floridani]|uniref:Cytochrome b/b6/petB-like protein n=1 Tax=Ophiocordyceps camponoti-floridani TaxID=2030778 RepID=A0A8H4QBC0_9HYPO|nr:cytochrome b/b6/petB-like protein [Ophiocordyceps camponoti-floridani]
MLSRALVLLCLLSPFLVLAQVTQDGSTVSGVPPEALSALSGSDQQLQKRQGILDGLAGGLKNLVTGFTGDGNKTDGTGGAGNPLAGIVGKVTDSLLGGFLNLSGPALADAGFLGGVGAGIGAVQGFELLPVDATKAAGDKVAEENGVKRTSIGDTVQKTTTGLVATALRSFRESNPDLDLASVASSLGSGIGTGTAEGLRLTGQDGASLSNSSDVAGVTSNFAFGLSRSLADSVDLDKVKALVPNMQQADGSRIASGFARGLMSGVVDGVEAIGGVSSLLGGNATRPVKAAADSDVGFDDSIGGLATSFGQGLGSAGTLALQRVFSKPRAGDGDGPGLRRRAVDGVGTPAGGLTAGSISAAVQKAVDMLEGPGIGGIGLILAGLHDSGAVPLNSDGAVRKAAEAIRGLIPPGEFHFTQDGDTFDIDGRQIARVLDGTIFDAAEGIRVNGHSFGALVALVVLHCVLALLALGFFFPLALTIHSTRNLLVRVDGAHLLPLWTVRVERISSTIVGVPLVLISFILGAVTVGNGVHFQRVHAFLGVITTVLLLFAAPLFFVSSRRRWFSLVSRVVFQQLLISIMATFVSGLVELSGMTLGLTQVVPFVLTVAAGGGLGAMLFVAQAVFGFDALLAWRRARVTGRVNEEEEAVRDMFVREVKRVEDVEEIKAKKRENKEKKEMKGKEKGKKADLETAMPRSISVFEEDDEGESEGQGGTRLESFMAAVLAARGSSEPGWPFNGGRD